MASTTKTWTNNSAPACEDVDLNGFKDENNNLIEGSGQTRQNEVSYRLAITSRYAQITSQEVGDVVQVLNVKRGVQTQFFAKLLNVFSPGNAQLPQHHDDRVAWHKLEH